MTSTRLFPPCSTSSFDKESGVALVMVLWMLALLTVIAGNVAFSVRTETRAVSNVSALAKAEAAADAGIHKAIYEVLRPIGALGRWDADGTIIPWAFGDANIYVTIRDESGKIDLNYAPANLLAALFRVLEIPEQEALSLADAIVDWRDTDNLRSLHGAEVDEYLAAGRPFGPANLPFQAIDELRLVLGMRPEIFRAIERVVTIHSRQGNINTASAPPLVLLAMKTSAAPSLAQVNQGSRYLGIEVEAVLEDNTRFARMAVVRISGNTLEPFSILAYRTPRFDAATTPGVEPN